jgi:hypothetical protein
MKKYFIKFIIVICIGTLGCFIAVKIGPRIMRKALDPAGLTPWQCVGGCGTGGSGSRSTGIKWIGEGVNGGTGMLEYLPKVNFGRTFAFATVEPRLTLVPKTNIEVGVSVPLTFASAEVQNDPVFSPQTFNNGGTGDITADITQKFGDHGQYSWQFALTLPSGSYDERRGPEQAKEILPQKLQMGRGVYTGELRLSYALDFDRSMALFEGSFNYPFMMSPSGKNAYIASDYKAYRSMAANRERFYYRFKPYGENDRGGYFPPSLNFDVVYAFRRISKTVQSFQFFFSAPLGVRWMPSYNPSIYDPVPDPDNRAWEAVLAYGIEFSNERFPVFMAFGLPIHDTPGPIGPDKYDSAPFAKWNGPAWKEFGQEWIMALGFKTILF